jgi:hypothetical protein
MNKLAPFLSIAALAVIIAVVIIAFLNYLIKSRIIASGRLDENYIKLLEKPSDEMAMLKWGILFLFAGTGLVVLQFVPLSAEESPVPWGIEMIFLAAGFITYYKIAKAP